MNAKKLALASTGKDGRHSGFSARRTVLAVAVAMGFGITGQAIAQSSTGAIFGTVPVAAGETILVQSSSGVSREVAVDSKGKYSISSLPLGSYTVSLRRDGTTVDSHSNVTLTVGAGTQVSFAPIGTNSTTLSTVTVKGSALPPIDISQVDSRTVITADQLAKLPLQRTAEAIATLAPGVNQGSGYFTSPTGQVLNSFGGSSIAENAYYINGFNTSDVLHNYGGMTLPYGAIDQEQVLTGGYGAAFGRSDGGVINQVGKRGTDDWHFGGQVLWQPEFAEGDPTNYMYPSGPKFLANGDPNNGGRSLGQQQGQELTYRNDNKSWTETADAYFGGPLIKDKLYIFGAVEANRQQDGENVANVESPTVTNYKYNDPKWYGKIDWNINDSNILELTGASNKTEYSGNTYNYIYPTSGYGKGTYGSYLGPDTHTKDGQDLWTAKYTNYITDSLTFEALYGKMKQTDYSEAAYAGDVPSVLNPGFQNPAYGGGNIIPGTVRKP